MLADLDLLLIPLARPEDPTPWELGTLTHRDASLGLEHLQLLLDL